MTENTLILSNVTVTYQPYKKRTILDPGIYHGHVLISEDALRGLIVGSELIHRKRIEQNLTIVYDGSLIDIRTEAKDISKRIVPKYLILYRNKRIPANNLEFVRGILIAFNWLSPRTKPKNIYEIRKEQWLEISQDTLRS